MNGHGGYAVFFFPQALEALGEAIKPYLTNQPEGPHVFCRKRGWRLSRATGVALTANWI